MDHVSEVQPTESLGDLPAEPERGPHSVGQAGELSFLEWRTEGDSQLGQPNHGSRVARRMDWRPLLRNGVQHARAAQRRALARDGQPVVLGRESVERGRAEPFASSMAEQHQSSSLKGGG